MRWLAIQRSEGAISEQTFFALRAASDGAEAELREFLDQLKERLVQITRDRRINDAVRDAATQSKSKAAADDLAQIVSTMVPDDVQELWILNEHGEMLAGTLTGASDAKLARTEYFTRGVEAFYGGDVFRDPSSGRLGWIMSAPIKDLKSNRLLGVAAFRIDPRKLSDLTSGRRILSKGANSQSFRVEGSGETYIVNRDGWMITESRYLSNSVLNVKVDTTPVRAAINGGQEITGRYPDYRGVIVSGASAVLQNPEWILITEIDFKEAFAPLKRLRSELVFATFGLILLALCIAWSSTWHVLNPIRLLSESDGALAEQNIERAFVSEVNLPNDEIGDLVRMRNSRVRAVFAYQKQLEDRTLKLQEMIGEIEHISYAIVHDMRAPLRAMQGFASILLETEENNLSAEERRSFLTKISQAAIRLDHLIQDVLTYNKTVLLQSPLHSVDLGPILNGILDTHPDLTGNCSISIEGTMPTVTGNEALLTKCFSNILDNAVRFIKPDTPPRIRIWSEPAPPPIARTTMSDKLPPKFVRVWIEDNGTGLTETTQTKIFDLFQRHSDNHEGTGVGLAIVRKVVEQMSGRVGVVSELGKGSRFWVDLPEAARDPRRAGQCTDGAL